MNPLPRRILVGVIVALILAAGIWKWRHRELPSSLLDFAPIDAQHVVVVRCDARETTSTAFADSYVELATPASRLWRSTLPQTSDVADGPGFLDDTVVTGDVIVVRSMYRDRLNGQSIEWPRLQGVRGEDGKLLWTASPLAGRPKSEIFYRQPAASLLVVGLRVIAFFTEPTAEGDQTTLVAYEPESGREVWRAMVPAPDDPQPVWVRGTLVLVAGRDGTVLFDAETGQTRGRLAAGKQNPACVLGDVAWTFGGGEIHELTFGNLTERTLPGPAAAVHIDGPCGARGTSVWLLATQGEGKTEEHLLLALDRTSGAEVGRIALGPHDMFEFKLARAADLAAPDEQVFAGELPRFVPRLVLTSDRSAQLLMIDLDERRVAWKSRVEEELVKEDQMWFRRGKQHVLVRGSTLSNLQMSTFSSDTGAFVAATECDGCRLFKLDGERMWWSDDWAIASVDLRTMAVTPFLETLKTHDITEAMQELLGPATAE